MSQTLSRAFKENFLGSAPDWYKMTIIGFLVLNPILLAIAGPYFTGWVIVLEFIFTLAMALKCYPLQPGGLIALEVMLMGLTTPKQLGVEIEHNLEVILLLIFMVAGIYFMKNLLLFIFTRVLLGVRSKLFLSLMFCVIAAFLSAFLDALTVTAVIISVAVGFYGVYHRVASGGHFDKDDHDQTSDEEVKEHHRENLEQFRAFLRSLLMHAAVGTALGGVCTMVGEPQNLLIAERAHWNFVEFFWRMSPVTIPVFIVGVITCAVLEKTKAFGYGTELPEEVREVMQAFSDDMDAKRTTKDVAALWVQAITGVFLIIGLLFHLAAVGLIGLTVIVLITAFTGIVEEHQLGHAFEEALPFTALLTVFFAIVAMIGDQDLLGPIIAEVLTMEGNLRIAMFYLANGVLSMISDNVFVATVYMNEITNALANDLINRDLFDELAVAINTGTNIPSVATPNGQAAFLFLLTSTVAPLVRLSYVRMVVMALPYTITMSITGFLMVYYVLDPMTDYMYDKEIITHHQKNELIIEAEKNKGY